MKPDFNVYLDGTRLDGETKGAVSGVRVFLTHSGASAFEHSVAIFRELREVNVSM